jgi:hypothetical protein
VSPDLLTALKDQTLLKTLGLIGGEWVGSVDGSTFDVSLRHCDTPCVITTYYIQAQAHSLWGAGILRQE